MSRRSWVGAVVIALLLAGCSGGTSSGTGPGQGSPSDTTLVATAPMAVDDVEVEVEVEELPASTVATVDAFVDRLAARIYDPINHIDAEVVRDLGTLDDDRFAWLVADGLRFVGRGEEFAALVDAGIELGGIELDGTTAWRELNDHLIETDRPAPPGYADWKREIYVAIDATWAPFFDDPGADVDWRLVTFGGVLADRRPFGSDDTCQCIAALDEPPAEPADEIDWLHDGDPIIGLVANGEARAYPLHIMEQHELVNDQLGGERISLAYCTLCGSGQAYRLDSLPAEAQPAVLRTSGLLYRSNKLMFDLTSRSLVETFTGEAWTGPWREAGIVLEQIPTVTSQWGAWRTDHPETTVMTGRNGTGADYPLDPLGGRDEGGPIFPVGEIDGRLFPQTEVIGVTAANGRPVAFPVAEGREALAVGTSVELDGVLLELAGSGFRATDAEGRELVAHQAYWFAWSQFHPDTELWTPEP